VAPGRGGCLRLGITREAADQLTYVTQWSARNRVHFAPGRIGMIESQKVVSDLIARGGTSRA